MTSKSTPTPKKLSKPSGSVWKGRDYQLKAVKFLYERRVGGLFLDPGLGKTSITLAAISKLKANGELEGKRIIIVAPLRVCYSVWPKEIQKWSNFSHLSAVVLHGKDKEKLLWEDHDIYLINPEGLEWLFGIHKVRSEITGKVAVIHDSQRVKKLKLGMLVVDESDKFKHPNSIRFKIIRPLLPLFGWRWILTGTPTANGLMDLFGQVYLMDLGRSLGAYITHFRRNFFDSTGFGGYTYIPKFDAAERIQKLLKPLVLRMEARDYLKDLPVPVPNYLYVELPPKAKKAYLDMEKKLITVLSESRVTAESVAVSYNKCRQLANGAIYKDAEERKAARFKQETWIEIHDEKIQALRELHAEINGAPLLVAYDFEHDLERLRKAFPKAVCAADYSAKAFAEVEERWNAGEIPMLLGHPQSLGHGMNLQGACQHVAWYAGTFNLALYKQFNERVLRDGNKHAQVFIHHILAAGTIDEVMFLDVESKALDQESFLEALKRYAKTKPKIF